MSNRILLHRNEGKKVYIIALSRKMPRFFDWMHTAVKNGQLTSPEVLKLCEQLKSDKVEITTEYAIPLIFGGYAKTSKEKVAGIIADDVIIFGATLQRISMQWWAFSGDVPYVVALFRGMNGVIAKILESDHSFNMPRLKDSQLEVALDTISRNIHSTSLPIDMEYPLIYSHDSYERVKNYMIEMCPQTWPRYEVESKSYVDSSKSFSILLMNCQTNGYTNDYTKVRLFRKLSKCCLEMIAPNYVNVRDLKKQDLFTCEGQPHAEKYSLAWRHVFHKLNVEKSSIDSIFGTLQDVLINTSILSSLIIWAEYLYSLSAFVANRNILCPKDVDIYIRKEDLSLILGSATTEEVYNSISYILSEQIAFNPELAQATLQDYVNPKDIKDLYLKQLISVIKEGNTVSENLDALFRTSHFTSEICRLQNKKNTFGHHCIGESFESLLDKIKFSHPGDNNILEEINKWIDTRIDECRVAPKYEIVLGSDRQRYYRRLFLCGSNKI